MRSARVQIFFVPPEYIPVFVVIPAKVFLIRQILLRYHAIRLAGHTKKYWLPDLFYPTARCTHSAPADSGDGRATSYWVHPFLNNCPIAAGLAVRRPV